MPRAIWFAANPPLRIDTLPPEDDGIQLTIPRLLTSNPTDDFLCKTIFTLWYIWKARNDNRFQRKNWSPLQVHHAVVAHLNTHMLALREVLQIGCTDQQALAVPPIVSNHGPQHQQQASPNSAAVPSAATNHNSQLRQGNEATHASNPTHQMDRYTV